MTDKFPTLLDIEKASAEQLARWVRLLLPENAEQQKILEKAYDQLKAKGGIGPDGGINSALSQKIGYGGV